MPIPPRMSSLESSAARFGVASVLLYGSGALPVFATPLTCETALPPMCGRRITSYFDRRFPSRSFWSEK